MAGISSINCEIVYGVHTSNANWSDANPETLPAVEMLVRRVLHDQTVSARVLNVDTWLVVEEVIFI